MSTLQLLDIGLTDNTPVGWFAVLVVVVLLIVVSRIVWRAVHGQGNADCRRNV